MNSTLGAERGWRVMSRIYIEIDNTNDDATGSKINPTSLYRTIATQFSVSVTDRRSFLDGECYNRLNGEYDSARLSIMRDVSMK